MLAYFTWFVVMVAGASAALAATGLAAENRIPQVLTGVRGRLVAIASSAVLLVVLALLWRISAVAEADGRVVVELTNGRGQVLGQIMTVITTMGDAIPSLLIATILALVIYRQGRHRLLVLLVPVAVVVELLVQIGMTNTFHDVTVHQVAPQIVDGGFGTIPSGSVARLLAIFLITSHLWRSHDDRGASRLATVGCVLVVVQLVTRLYLGRHLLADIGAGILLGVLLERLAALVILGPHRESKTQRSSSAPPRVSSGPLAPANITDLTPAGREQS